MARKPVAASGPEVWDLETRIEHKKIHGAFYLFLFSMSVPYVLMINLRYIMIGGFVPPLLDQTTGAVETVLAIASAVTAWMAYSRSRAGNAAGYRAAAQLTLSLGLIATLMLLYELWVHPLNPMSHYGETFLATVGLCVVMQLMGLLALWASASRVKRMGMTDSLRHGYELVSIFWMFNVVTWIVVYIELYYL